MKNSSQRSCLNNQGSLLVLTLWSILFLAFLSLTLSSHVAARLLVASDMKWSPRVRAMGVKALADVLALMKEDKTITYDSLQESWADDPTRFEDVPYGEGSYSLVYEEGKYGLRDEERKINLNRAPASVLSRLLQVGGKLTETGANELANAMVDWRDLNSTTEKESATLPEDCLGAPLPARCKNSDFEVLEELFWIPGMTADLFREIQDDLTLYGEGPLNINTAGVTSLRAVGLSEAAAGKIAAWRDAGNFFGNPSEIMGRSGELGLVDTDLSKLQGAVSTGLLGVRSDFYQARAQAKFGGRVRGQVRFIVNRKGEVKEWKE